MRAPILVGTPTSTECSIEDWFVVGIAADAVHDAARNDADVAGMGIRVAFADAARALEPVYWRETSEPTLRPELGAPGIPGESNKDGNIDMVQRAAELIREQQRKAGMIK